MTFRSLIVAAVSTAAQADEEKASIPEQLRACRELCESRSWQVTKEITISGHSRAYSWLHEIVRDSPEYADLVATIESGTIDLVICRDYDRLWRTDALRAQVTALCREHRAQVFSLNQPVEPVSPENLATSDTSQLAEILFGWVSEQENRTRQRRRRVGMESRVRRGLACCGPFVPYGYKREDGQIIVDDSEAYWLRRIYDWRLAGDGYTQIAETLTQCGVPPPNGRPPGALWYHTTIIKILTNPFYAGGVHWGDVYNPTGQHELLIDPEIWHHVQRINESRRRQHGFIGQRGNYPLTGLLRCGYCHGAMHYRMHHRKSGSYLHIRCGRYMRTRGRECQSNGMRVDGVHGYVLAAVQRALRNPEAWAQAQRKAQPSDEQREELRVVESQLEDARRRYEQWSNAYERRLIDLDQLAARYARIEAESGRWEHRRDDLIEALQAAEGTQRRMVDFSDYVDRIPSLSPAQQRGLYTQLIRAVEVRRSQKPIIFWW